MEPLPLALIGCGLMGARHLRGYAELERVAPGSLRLVAVVDPAPELAEAVAAEAEARLGYRPARLAGIDLLPGSGAVAADVVTPNRTHDALVGELLAQGLHVQCEKPLAVTIARGRRMIAAAEAARRLLVVAENNRRDPSNRLLRAVVQAGLIGDLTYASQVSVNRGGSVIGTPWRHRLAMGGLPLDVWLHLGYSLELAAGPIERVMAVGGLLETERRDRHGQPVACNSPDLTVATLTFANGATGSWVTHFASPGRTAFERLLIGTTGTALGSPDRQGRGVTLQRGGEILTGEALLRELPRWRLNEIESRLFGERPATYDFPAEVTDRKLIAAETADFLATVRDGTPPEVPAELGLRSVAIILALMESIEAGRPVTVAEVLSGATHAFQDRIEADG